jgi:hypothetical protein
MNSKPEQKMSVIVSDYVADIVMLSLKTCNMNCGNHWEGKGRVGSKGWAVDHQGQVWMDIRTTITKKGISK